MAGYLRKFREHITPVLKSSAFTERGVITPEEFVEAGDNLIYKCPNWSWECGKSSRRRKHLPMDKQFLIIRNVPCHRRVASLEADFLGEVEVWAGAAAAGPEGGKLAADQEEGASEEPWVMPSFAPQGDTAPDTSIRGDGSSGGGLGADEVLGTIGGADESKEAIGSMGGVLAAALENDYFASQTAATQEGGAAAGVGVGGEGEEYTDMAGFEEPNLLAEGVDQATLQPSMYMTAEEPPPGENDNILRTRTYDVSITYDKYYQTPRVWLFGYDEDQQPLSADQIFEDVMQDHVRQTVTMENHPQLETVHASIHPCQHGAVMQRIVRGLSAGGREPEVQQYLFIFLKFIQSMIPTVEYDYTMSVES